MVSLTDTELAYLQTVADHAGDSLYNAAIVISLFPNQDANTEAWNSFIRMIIRFELMGLLYPASEEIVRTDNYGLVRLSEMRVAFTDDGIDFLKGLYEHG